MRTAENPSSQAISRLPPHDPESEAGALACLIELAAEPNFRTLKSQISLEDFYDERHREIFRVMDKLVADGFVPNTINVRQILRSGPLDANSKDTLCALVLDLPNHIPSPANFPYYRDILKEFSARRMAIHESAIVQEAAFNTSIPAKNIKLAAKRLLESRTEAPELNGELQKRHFDPTRKPPPLRPIYSLCGVPVSTPGNLTTITSAIKTGKSAVIGAMAGSSMAQDDALDMLGFQSSNPEGKALLWFDSEQSPDDFWTAVHRSIVRSGLEQPPPWLHPYCLTGLPAGACWAAVLEALQLALDTHPGIHSILLDGAADFVADVNDAAQSNAFVAELHGLSIRHDCPIVAVIHFNPGTEKSRGHLGSQLERKAETNLALEKDDNEATTIYSTKNRRSGIPKSTGPRFVFDQELQRHILTTSRQADKDAVLSDSLSAIAQDIFAGHPALASLRGRISPCWTA